MTGALLLYPYARPGTGLGRRAKTGAGAQQLVIATATALLATALAWWAGLGWTAVLLFAVVALVAFLVALWIQSRIRGLTGDGLGAICEIGEVAGLLTLVALVYRGVLP